ncbi:peptide chain release factor 1 [Candidatus Saccharibacteria bacterium]|nr:peptide chain release factor 1 [Candidatus Saccharibacteria bacterium]
MIDQDKINTIKQRLSEVEAKLADPAIYTTPDSAKLVAEQRDLQTRLSLFEQLASTEKQLTDAQGMLNDPDMKDLAAEEIEKLEAQKAKLEAKVRVALIPTDPNDNKNAIIEIRAGAGGDESSIFAGDLARMYGRFCENHELKVQIMSDNPNPAGGYKEIILEITGPQAYGTLKFESGVHRVQRVPVTESAGRIHTSTATVAVLPEAEESDIDINPADVRTDVYRSSGHGGQSVNTTDSAVRLTHIPTGIVVTCQDEKSQLKNKLKAMSVLRSRLLALRAEEEAKKLGEARRGQIGTGDRSEKIRTYNYPQDRITDHRIGYTTHNMPKVMDGGLDDLLEHLRAASVQKSLEEQQND